MGRTRTVGSIDYTDDRYLVALLPPHPLSVFYLHDASFASLNTTVRALTYTCTVVAGRTTTSTVPANLKQPPAYLAISQRSDNLKLLIDSCEFRISKNLLFAREFKLTKTGYKGIIL